MTASTRLLHITDTHLHAQKDARMRGVNTYETLQAVVQHARSHQHQPDAIIATGDLVQDETEHGYELFRETIDQFGVPTHCLPGNHDSQKIMADVLGTAPYHYCGHATYRNWVIVMLNTVVRLDDSGHLSTAELQRLDETLRQHADHHALVCMHHHPYPMNSRWLDGVSLDNGDDFFTVLDQHRNVRCVTWGHVHQASDRQRESVRLISTPSTSSQFMPDSDMFRLDTRPPGYRWMELRSDGTIDTDVVWLD